MHTFLIRDAAESIVWIDATCGTNHVDIRQLTHAMKMGHGFQGN